MVSYQSLRDAKPELFGAAASRIRELSDLIEEKATAFGDTTSTLADPAVRSGPDADAAVTFCTNRRKMFFENVDHPRGVADVLEAGEAEFSTWQGRLAQAEALAAQEGLTISPDGTQVSFPPISADTQAGADDVAAGKETAAREVAQAIQEAIGKATAADTRLQAAFNEFNEALVDPAAEAAEQRAVAADAHRAAELAGQEPADLSFGEGRELAALLAEHGGDPVFATELLRTMGPQGFLEFADQIDAMESPWNSGGATPGASTELVGTLQAQLGETLATATDPGRHPQLGPQWTDGLLTSAAEWDEGMDGDGGYRALGVLLHSGDYSPEFLNRVGDDMIARDRVDPFSGSPADNNHIDDLGHGGDPLVGLMTALDRNPEAATAFLDPGRGGAEGHLQYLLEDREWPVDFDDRAPGALGPPPQEAVDLGHNVLGEALEAATLEGEPGERGAAIVAETVHLLGGGTEPYGELIPPPLRDSVGAMVGGHMGTVQQTLTYGGHVDDPSAHRVNSVTGEPTFDKSSLLRVMGDAAIDPNAYATMYDANTAATTIELEQIATDPALGVPEKQETIVRQAGESAKVFGALDQAKQYAVEQHYDNVDAEYNRLIDAGGTIGIIGAGALGTLGGPVGGAGGAAGAAAVTELVDTARQDSSGRAGVEAGSLTEAGQLHSRRLAEQVLYRHELWNQPPPADLAGSSYESILHNADDRWLQQLHEGWAQEGYPPHLAEHINGIYDDGTVEYVNDTGALTLPEGGS